MITRQFDIILNTKILNTLTSNMVVTQNDKDTNVLKIKVFDGDSEIDYTQVDHARIFFEKRDKEVIQGDLTKVSDGFTYQMGTNEIACNGEVLTIIHLYGSNNERLATSKFKFEVERDLENKNAIKSSSQYSALETIIVEFREEVSKLQEEVNKIIAEGSTNIPEIINARHSTPKNKQFNTLKERLDDVEQDTKLNHDKISILEEANNSQTADLAKLNDEISNEKKATVPLGYPNNIETINSKIGGNIDVKIDGNMEDVTLDTGVVTKQPVQNPYVRVQGKNLIDFKTSKKRNDSKGTLELIDNGVILNDSYYFELKAYNLKLNIPYTLFCEYEQLTELGIITPAVFWRIEYADGTLSGGTKIGKSLTPIKEVKTIYLYHKDTEDVFKSKFSNIQLEEGTTATDYEPYRESIGIIPTHLAKVGDVKDRVIGIKGTKAIVDRKNKRIKLDESLDYSIEPEKGTGWKRICVTNIFPYTINSTILQIMKKHNGSILEQYDSTPTKADQFILFGATSSYKGQCYISVSNTDTGWGDSYTPTSASEEIKAYFMGWKMYPAGTSRLDTYNGTGRKAWYRITELTKPYDPSREFLDNPPTESYPEWTPYELFYVLETPRTEEIEMNIIGDSFSLEEGVNTVEVGIGLVYEKATVGQYTTFYEINTTLVPETQFMYKAENIMSIYKNKANSLSIDNQNWVFDKGSGGTGKDCWGKMRLYQVISDNLFDSQAEYYILYEMIPELYTCQPTNVEIIYSENIRDSLNSAVKKIGEVSGDVSQINKEMLSKLQVPEGYRLEVVEFEGISESTEKYAIGKIVPFKRAFSEKPRVIHRCLTSFGDLLNEENMVKNTSDVKTTIIMYNSSSGGTTLTNTFVSFITMDKSFIKTNQPYKGYIVVIGK
ncbi:BppU family phage baseplate upper protein [Inediibacterium massiliense]|uniref:BppU family phage baseplate upper protein n=1 Tax=Inediibacterium massiliense TaxID=1658111 RepID=UPI0006B481B0|nr:BppU family phage baseplate upper protein [Inediibacterium massiliense]